MKHVVRQLGWLVLVAVLPAGCGDGLAAPPREAVLETGPVVATDHASYSWRRDTALAWLLANPDGVSAFYYPGNHVYLEHYDGEHWRLIGLYGFIETEPRRLRQGDTLSASVPLSNETFSTSGWYRVHARLFRDSALTLAWPIGNRVSSAVWVGP